MVHSVGRAVAHIVSLVRDGDAKNKPAEVLSGAGGTKVFCPVWRCAGIKLRLVGDDG